MRYIVHTPADSLYDIVVFDFESDSVCARAAFTGRWRQVVDNSITGVRAMIGLNGMVSAMASMTVRGCPEPSGLAEAVTCETISAMPHDRSEAERDAEVHALQRLCARLDPARMATRNHSALFR